MTDLFFSQIHSKLFKCNVKFLTKTYNFSRSKRKSSKYERQKMSKTIFHLRNPKQLFSTKIVPLAILIKNFVFCVFKLSKPFYGKKNDKNTKPDYSKFRNWNFRISKLENPKH